MPLRQPALPPHDAGAQALSGPYSAVQPWPAAELQQRLAARYAGFRVEVQPELDSTNTQLLARARQGDTGGTLLVAEQQTAGRGRLGRTWFSAPGASLTASLALPLAPVDWAGLSLAVGVALADALDPLAAPGLPPRIGLKWPNDLWLLDAPQQGRKLGGILIETVSVGSLRQVVIGFGLNVRDLPPADGAAPAFSQGRAALQELDARWSAPAVLARVAEPLLEAVLAFEVHGFLPLQAAYARRDVLRGQAVQLLHPGEHAPQAAGRADGVDASGALRLRTGDRVQVVSSGEVSVRPATASSGAGSA